MRFRAAVGSMLVGGVLAGAAVMPAAAGAHGNTGPLCYGNEDPYGYMAYAEGGIPPSVPLYYNEPFRIKKTIVFAGGFWSLGHSASTYPTDHWVYTPSLRC